MKHLDIRQTALLCLYLFLSTFTLVAQAQGRGHIAGTVVDVKTKEALPFAQVIVKGTNKGTTTDSSGAFLLNDLPEGTYTLEARLVGYGSAQERVQLRAGQTRHIDFYLSESSIDLDGVVISANRQVTLRKMAPSLITVLSGDTFIKTNSDNLSQGLRFQPGLRIEDNCQNCGFNQVRINGLQGAYSQVLIDSRPIFSALAAVYGLEQIPASMIERVEVIRGAGSALFGSNAVGGVINVITREPLRNTASLSHTYTTLGTQRSGFTSLQSTTSFNGSLVTDDRNGAVMIFGQHSARAGHDYNADGFSELPELKNRSLGFRGYYKTGLYGKLTAEYRSMHEYRRGGDRLDEAPFHARISEYLQHYINGGSLRFDQGSRSGRSSLSIYASVQEVLRKSYYGGGGRPDELVARLRDADDATAPDEVLSSLTAYGISKSLDANAGAVYIRKLPKSLDLTMGLEGTWSLLNDKSGFRASGIDQRVSTYSNFTQLEYKSDWLNFLLGGRLDYVRLSQAEAPVLQPLLILSPRANLRYNPVKDLSLRLSYSEGFRAPQFFDEEMHVELAGGAPIARILSDNLKEERSRSFSASADWYADFATDWQYNLMLEGFVTLLSNQFVDSPVQTERNGIRYRTIVNNSSGSAKVYGCNIEGKLAYRRLWDVQAGLTLQRSLYGADKVLIEADDESAQAEISTRTYERTPNIYGYFTSTLRPTKRLSLILSGTYTGAMLVPHEAYEGMPATAKLDDLGRFEVLEQGQYHKGVALGRAYLAKTNPFFDADIKVAYEYPLTSTITLDASVGIQNIFDAYQQDADRGPGRASTYVYGPVLPRRLFVSLALRL